MKKTTLSYVAGMIVLGSALLPATVGAQASLRQQGLVSFQTGRIFYEVVGEGDPMVVVHGGPGLDHSYMRPGLDVLAGASSLVYYDQRGTGRSEAALDPESINLDAFVEDIESLRRTLAQDQVTVLGHSFGALIALAYAMAHPDRTRSLILLAPVEPGTRWQAEAGRRAAQARSPEDVEELARLRASPGYEARDPNTVSQMYRLAYRGTLKDPSRIEDVNLSLSRQTAENGSEVARLLGASMGQVDWWADLEDLTVPTLVIHGRHDVMPVEMSRELAAVLPNGQLAVLESGHFPFVEDPRGLMAAVTDFLAGISR